MQLPVQDIVQPKPKRSGDLGVGAKQAVCAEPGMIRILEEQIVSLHSAGDPSWVGLLSQWLMSIASVRLAHLKRSVPEMLSGSTFYAWCKKGKQTTQRGGFPWTAPVLSLIHI